MRDLVFLDTETTGLDPRRHEIIDIWARRVRADTLELVAEAGGLVTPARIEDAEPRALEVNGFDPIRWHEESVRWQLAWGSIKHLLEGAQFVGSNPAFDLRFIEEMNRRHGIPSQTTTRFAVDTASMAQPLRASGAIRSCSLGALCDHFGVEVEAPAHSARGDVLRTIEVYRKLMEMWR